MKGSSKKTAQALDDSDNFSDENSNLDEEERAAVRMLPSEQRKLLGELE